MTTALRHVTSINDLSNEEIEGVFDLAQRFLSELGDTRLKGRAAEGRIAAHRKARNRRGLHSGEFVL